MNKKQIQSIQTLTSRTVADNCEIKPSMVCGFKAEETYGSVVVQFQVQDESETFNTSIVAKVGPRGATKVIHKYFWVA